MMMLEEFVRVHLSTIWEAHYVIHFRKASLLHVFISTWLTKMTQIHIARRAAMS